MFCCILIRFHDDRSSQLGDNDVIITVQSLQLRAINEDLRFWSGFAGPRRRDVQTRRHFEDPDPVEEVPDEASDPEEL